MNWCVISSKGAVAAWLSAGFVMVLPVAAAPVAQPAVPEVVSRSTFVIPTNPKEGRDPFFPNSTRLYEVVLPAQPHVADVSSLILKGISGPSDHRLAIINNRTFAVGDEESLATPHGPIHVRCVEIKADSVVIETGGQRHELNYTNNR
jgi:hypothetical protein